MRDAANEIYSARIVDASIEKLYQAFENPLHLKNWWGPEGFTNTIHEFNLTPGGVWRLTMHGPEKGNYENVSLFKTVIPQKRITWTRLTQPFFDMEVGFKDISGNKSEIYFKMIFNTAEESNKMKKFVIPKNEENFNRLEKTLSTM
ncbi:MAG: SRPBCC domain-containing protein [Flavobacteriaceae bacterium]